MEKILFISIKNRAALKDKLKKMTAILISVAILGQTVLPTRLYAMNGPSSPEFSSFQSVSSAGMVNEFTGSFSYNIPLLNVPGPNGSGYPINLSYQSGTNPDADASWVGYGWTLSPGAIERNKQGYPDDVLEGDINKYNKRRINWNVNLKSNALLEAFSLDVPAEFDGSSISVSALINSHNGLSVVSGLEGSFSSGTGFNMDLGITSDGNHSFDVNFSPSEYYKSLGDDAMFVSHKNINDLSPWDYYDKSTHFQKNGYSLSKYAPMLTANHSFPSYVSNYTGIYASIDWNVLADPMPVPVALGVTLGGSVGFTWVPEEDEITEMVYYGYLHSAEAINAQTDEEVPSDVDAGLFRNNILMDYSVEKEASMNERDYYLGIPYSGADNFMVMGEGIGGTFRAYSKGPGHFKSNKAANVVGSLGLGVDLTAGVTLGTGFKPGIGGQFVATKEWYTNSDYNFSSEGDEAFYFQFMGDLGSSVDFGGDNAVAANLEGDEITGFDPVIPSSIYEKANNSDDRVKRSSYIGYHTIKEMLLQDGDLDGDDEGAYYKRYNQRSDIETLAARSLVDESQIGEFYISNTSGLDYIYGLPVYVKEEESVSASITPTTDFITHQDISNPDEKIGEYNGEKYAQTWLLTQITTPDFIDTDLNGPDEGDYGGWTIFNYEKLYGEGTSAWYNYRMPYTGLYNNPARLSDSKDDMGSYSSGKKEMYYWQSVETQTHIAFFTTSSDRTDGYDAWDDNEVAASDDSKKGSHGIKKLEKITLYAKDDNNEDLSDNVVLQTVHFQYDYSLMQGQPNSIDGSGKLTLKRIWIEYADVKNAKISPYDFVYEYPAIGSYATTPYSSLEINSSNLIQNPAYNKLNIDRWGSYQAEGESRFNSMNPWIDQTPIETFDPAAWQLKQIKLPTGGEIHVQYEQNEYLYVQDKRAMVMASIDIISAPLGIEGQEDNIYYLNTEELGIDLTSNVEERDDYISYLQKKFIDGENGNDPEKIYFKFLYSLTTGEGVLGDCGMEWIDGYVSVREVGYEDGMIYLKLGDDRLNVDEGDLTITDLYDVPREVCKDYYNQTRAGKIDFSTTNCEIADIGEPTEDGMEDFFYSIVEFFDAAASAIGLEVCLAIDEPNSYFRIPLPTTTAKKGGGIRVKRILLYDKGLENNPTLNGQEYIYLNTDNTSSGVATNEPQTGGEENALIGFLEKRSDPDLLSRIMSGKDREEFEGPIGANMLPSPSVGYSRVVIRDINTGPSRPALVEKEFYTSKDYPLQVENTTLTKKILPIPAITYPISMSIYNIWASQGYSFVLNNMNGQPKAEKSIYPSNPTDINSDLQVLSSKEYIYYEPGEEIKTIDTWDWHNYAGIFTYYDLEGNLIEVKDPSFSYYSSIPGKHTEVIMESSQITEVAVDASIEGDIDISILGVAILPWPTFMPYFNYAQNQLSTHVINKITYYPAILKAVKVSQEGMEVTTKNEVFDSYTGSPVLTSTTDVYNNIVVTDADNDGVDDEIKDGTYYSYNFPASYYYDAMKGKCQNEAYLLESVGSSFNMDKIVNDNDGDGDGDEYWLSITGSGICDNMDKFTSGSLIAIYENVDGVMPEIFNIGEIKGGLIELLPTAHYYYDNIVEADDNGSESVSVEILRSGNTNQLGASVGSLTTYGATATATITEVPNDVIEAREAVVNTLNNQYKGVLTGITSSELASMSDAGIVNPTSNECEPFTVAYEDYIAEIVTNSSGTSSSGSTSTKAENDISFTRTSETYYGEKMVCTTIPAQFRCDETNTGIICVETVPERIECENVPTEITKEFITITVENASGTSNGSDGKDNDGDGVTDEPDEATDACEMVLSYDDDYEFFLDPETAELMYGDEANPCDAVQIDCIDFCPNYFPIVNLDHVVAASAIELSDDWSYGSELKQVFYMSSTDNEYETGEKGNWRLLSSYGYNTAVKNITDADAFTFNTGIFDEFTVFDWKYHDAISQSKWLTATTIQNYSPQGAPIEEKNLLGIYSTAKYGYDRSVPYLMAANADYGSVAFESFEYAREGVDEIALGLEDGYTILKSGYNQYYGEWTSTEAHSGSHSYKMGFVDGISELELPSFYPTSSAFTDGMAVKVWMKHTNSTEELFPTLIEETTNNIFFFNKVARVGEWELYEAKTGPLNATSFSIDDKITFKVGILQNSATEEVYIDDVMLKPLDAQISSYVYDPNTLRILAQFDDQNFGLFYQYNDEGKLVRKQIETERGLKSVAETQYNIPKVDK